MKKTWKILIGISAFFAMTIAVMRIVSGIKSGQSAPPDLTATPAQKPTTSVTGTPELTGTANPVQPSETPTPVQKPTASPVPTAVPEADPLNPLWWACFKCSDVEISTYDEIKAQNRRLFDDPATVLHRPDEAGTLTYAELKNMICSAAFPNREYLDGKALDDNGREEILRARNLSFPETGNVEPVYAVATENATLRSFPTASRLTNDSGEFDYFQETGVYIGEPLVVLWKTADGDWSYVYTLTYTGWVKSTTYGFCDKSFFDEYCGFYFEGNRSERLETMCGNTVERGVAIAGTDFGTERTSNELSNAAGTPSNTDPGASSEIGKGSAFDETKQLYLRIGTYLPIICESGQDKSGSETPATGQTTVFVPCKDADGRLKFSGVKADGEKYRTIGEIKYSEKNIVEIAGRLMGTPYSWGDETQNGMDCSSTMAAVYRCFGMFLPRNTSDQLKASIDGKDISGLDIAAKTTYIMERSAGTLLYFPGHVMMYLGEHNGRLYVLHNTTNITYEDGTAKKIMSCIISTLGCGNGRQTYLERLIQSLNIAE